MFYLFKQYENWSWYICLMQQTEILKTLMKVKVTLKQ